MAKKRMFDKAIIDTDNFMDLSMSSKALYFLLGMEADDEGFVSYKKVMRIHGGNEDDVKVLIAKSFLIIFPSGVVVITNWNKNNWLDSRRISPTEYQKEKNMLELTEDKEYMLSNGLASAGLVESSRVENRVVEKSIEETKGVSVSKQDYGELLKVKLTDDEYGKLLVRLGEPNTLALIEELDLYLSSKGKKYKSHYATLLSWARRKSNEHNSRKKSVTILGQNN